MDFALSSEHEMVQKMVRDFARKEVYPGIKEADRNQQMDPGVLPRMGELGIMGICIPVRYGGQGMDYIALGLACEELEAVDTTLRVAMSVHTGLSSMTLFQWGTEEQKQKKEKEEKEKEEKAKFDEVEKLMNKYDSAEQHAKWVASP